MLTQLQFAPLSGGKWQPWYSGDYIINYLLVILTMPEGGGEYFPSSKDVMDFGKEKLHERDKMEVDAVHNIMAATLVPHAYSI